MCPKVTVSSQKWNPLFSTNQTPFNQWLGLGIIIIDYLEKSKYFIKYMKKITIDDELYEENIKPTVKDKFRRYN